MKTKFPLHFAGSFMLLFCCLITSAQTKSESEKMLTQKKWQILEDKQAGIGKHNSLNAESVLTFNADSTWECTGEIAGGTKGIWYIKEAGHLYLKPGKNGKAIKCELITLTDELLQMKYKHSTTVRTLVWEAME